MSSKLKKHLPDAVENDSRTVMTVNKKCKKKPVSQMQKAANMLSVLCLCLLDVRQ